jgi:2-dehydropantoate 2-reductase
MLRFAIIGAGGVGGYFGGVLARAGHEVAVLARGPHLAALRSRGIEVRTPEGSFVAPVRATDDARQLGDADFALLAVKNYSLAEVLPAVLHVAAAGATIVPLLNGVDVLERLEAGGVPAARLLGGLTMISAMRIAPGIVERRSSFQRIVVGERDGQPRERAAALVAAFQAAGVEARVSTDIAADLWRKFAFIATAAAACGLARSPIGPVRDHPLGWRLLERGVREVMAVGRSAGVALTEADERLVLQQIESQTAGTKPSLLVDLEAGRPTEIDDLSGAVSRLAGRAGVETPFHDTATLALQGARGEKPPSEVPAPGANGAPLKETPPT